jgi:hypothetical protein
MRWSGPGSLAARMFLLLTFFKVNPVVVISSVSGGPRIDRPLPAGQTCQCLTDAYAINLSSHFFHLLFL